MAEKNFSIGNPPNLDALVGIKGKEAQVMESKLGKLQIAKSTSSPPATNKTILGLKQPVSGMNGMTENKFRVYFL